MAKPTAGCSANGRRLLLLLLLLPSSSSSSPFCRVFIFCTLKDGQCTYNVQLRGVRVTVFVVDKQ